MGLLSLYKTTHLLSSSSILLLSSKLIVLYCVSVIMALVLKGCRRILKKVLLFVVRKSPSITPLLPQQLQASPSPPAPPTVDFHCIVAVEAFAESPSLDPVSKTRRRDPDLSTMAPSSGSASPPSPSSDSRRPQNSNFRDGNRAMVRINMAEKLENLELVKNFIVTPYAVAIGLLVISNTEAGVVVYVVLISFCVGYTAIGIGHFYPRFAFLEPLGIVVYMAGPFGLISTRLPLYLVWIPPLCWGVLAVFFMIASFAR